MTRIAQIFDELKSSGHKGFIPFISAGDPDLETSEEIILKLADLGADVIELGVPFSDPMADGPTIQRSSMRALANGTNLKQVIELARNVRARSDVAIVLFSYLNPILNYGVERLSSAAAAAGIDGILITDAVDSEANQIAQIFRADGIDLISLIAPTTSEKRLRSICENASGFIYAVSRAGVTGARSDTSSTAEQLVKRARQYTTLPIAVGFGISTREQIEDVWRYADAAVVGSAIVAEIEKAGENAVECVEDFARGLLPQCAKTSTEI
jgi:tryptophan synthase alpha chain